MNADRGSVPDKLPWGIRSGSLASAIPLAAVPPYLRAEET